MATGNQPRRPQGQPIYADFPRFSHGVQCSNPLFRTNHHFCFSRLIDTTNPSVRGMRVATARASITSGSVAAADRRARATCRSCPSSSACTPSEARRAWPRLRRGRPPWRPAPAQRGSREFLPCFVRQREAPPKARLEKIADRSTAAAGRAQNDARWTVWWTDGRTPQGTADHARARILKKSAQQVTSDNPGSTTTADSSPAGDPRSVQ
jgi:hypothetical protein